MSGPRIDVNELSDADLESLRLSAQVMGHKAVVEEHPQVADFFARLELEFREHREARVADEQASPINHPALGPDASDSDRRLVLEYLGVLAANDRLSPAVRRLCRDLQAAFSA